ncbi:hypothetical protein OG21DRAFT_1521338 [Imleria badia]|nr:hypothetical protein OG21DRAFT_1521338 [Imleria badia]
MYQYPEMLEDIPEGWTAYRHPKGALYFVHGESKTFTEVNICDEDIYNDIKYFRTFLFSLLKTEIKKRNPSDSLKLDEVQLVLEAKLDKDCRGALLLLHKGRLQATGPAQYWFIPYSYMKHQGTKIISGVTGISTQTSVGLLKS